MSLARESDIGLNKKRQDNLSGNFKEGKKSGIGFGVILAPFKMPAIWQNS